MRRKGLDATPTSDPRARWELVKGEPGGTTAPYYSEVFGYCPSACYHTGGGGFPARELAERAMRGDLRSYDCGKEHGLGWVNSADTVPVNVARALKKSMEYDFNGRFPSRISCDPERYEVGRLQRFASREAAEASRNEAIERDRAAQRMRFIYSYPYNCNAPSVNPLLWRNVLKSVIDPAWMRFTCTPSRDSQKAITYTYSMSIEGATLKIAERRYYNNYGSDEVKTVTAGNSAAVLTRRDTSYRADD